MDNVEFKRFFKDFRFIIWLTLMLYLLLGIYGGEYTKFRISFSGVIVYLLFSLTFIVGMIVESNLLPKIGFIFPLILSFKIYGLWISILLGLVFAFIYFTSKGILRSNLTEKLWMLPFVVGTSVEFYGLISYGIPLLKPEIRPYVSSIFAFSSILIIVGAVFSQSFLLMLLSIILCTITSFRTYLLEALIASFFTSKTYRSRILVLVFGLIPFFTVGLLSISHQNWHIGMVELVFYRSAVTLGVFQKIVDKSFPYGYFYGALITSRTPRILVGREFLNLDWKYTYSFFGQQIADFGIIGLAETFLLGIYAWYLYRGGGKLSSLSPAILFPAIDIGFDGFNFY